MDTSAMALDAAPAAQEQQPWLPPTRYLRDLHGLARNHAIGFSQKAMRNLITDVGGIRIGNASDPKIATGTTAIVFDQPAIVAVDVRGGAPGTIETDLLEPHRTVERIDAVVLSGGSAFGLEAAGGVQAWLREQGRGFAFAAGDIRVPVVSGAIVFDLLNGGDKSWGRFSPYRELGYAAAKAADVDFMLGTAGAGFGANTVNFKGGLGSASAPARTGHVIGAVAAVNAAGSVTVGNGPHFWAAPFEQDGEFGGRGFPTKIPPEALAIRTKGRPRENTTIAIVATDAALTKTQAKQLAVMAQDGLARAIYPAHTTIDGDTVFAAATGQRPLVEPMMDLAELGATAANVLARAVARGVHAATKLPFAGALPGWRDRFGF
jgi:D-aminopeptidase